MAVKSKELVKRGVGSRRSARFLGLDFQLLAN